MNRLILITIIIGSTITSHAQLGNLKDKFTKNESSNSTAPLQSLDEVAAKWSDGSYGSKKRTSGMYEPAGKVDIKFKKNDDGIINIIVIGKEEYKAAKSESKSFVISYGGRYGALYLTESSIVMYSMRNGDVYVEKCYGSKIGIGAAEKEIKAFRVNAEETRDQQAGEYAEKAAEEAKKAEEARKKKYSLEGKEVVKIEIINLNVPQKFGHFRGFTFNMKATLKDGTTISTEKFDEGYISDYEIKYTPNTYAAEMFENKLESGFVDGDIIKVEVSCKSNPTLTVSETVTLKYNEDVSFDYRNGMTYNFGNGGNAMNYRFEVKQVKHAVTGADILSIRIYNITEGKLVSEFKMGIDQTLHFKCNGGNGGDEHTTGIGNGGNGGNITLVKDPSVKYFNFDYSNLGGNPGKSYSAVRGRDGSFKEESRKVNF